MLKQTFFEVDGSKLLKVRLTVEHRQLSVRRAFDFDGDAYPKRFIEELLIPCLASEPDVEAMIEMLTTVCCSIADAYRTALSKSPRVGRRWCQRQEHRPRGVSPGLSAGKGLERYPSRHGRKVSKGKPNGFCAQLRDGVTKSRLTSSRGTKP